MGSLWGSVMLLCGVVLVRTEGREAQQTKKNVPRLKLSYRGEFLVLAMSFINGERIVIKLFFYYFVRGGPHVLETLELNFSLVFLFPVKLLLELQCLRDATL